MDLERAANDDRRRLVDQLVDHEGLRRYAYVDTVGKITIGVGRNLTDKGITDTEALYLLDHDLNETITDLTGFAWFPVLDAGRQRALADLRFQVGPVGFRGFRQMIHALAVKNYAQAALELRRSRWATQVGPERREHVIALLTTGLDP